MTIGKFVLNVVAFMLAVLVLLPLICYREVSK
jgi:hypothetical protein